MWTTGSPKEGQRQCLQDLAISGQEQIKKVALTVTILKEDAETLLDKEVCVEDDQAEGERQNIIACSDFEEISNRFLQSDQLALYSVTQTLPKIDLYSGILSRQISTGVDLRVHAFAPCLKVSAAWAPSREIPDAGTSSAARKGTHDQVYLRHGLRTNWSQQAV
jgi:hypothetical protein